MWLQGDQPATSWGQCAETEAQSGFGPDLTYWCFLFAGLVLDSSFPVGIVPDAGWFAYVPLSGPEYVDASMDIWLFGLALAKLDGIGAAVAIVVVVPKTRAAGMPLNRLPIFALTMLAVALMILAALVPLLIASALLEVDRARRPGCRKEGLVTNRWRL